MRFCFLSDRARIGAVSHKCPVVEMCCVCIFYACQAKVRKALLRGTVLLPTGIPAGGGASVNTRMMVIGQGFFRHKTYKKASYHLTLT